MQLQWNLRREDTLGTALLSSLAGQPYFSYMHARMASGRGILTRKNTSGHSRQVFVPRKYARNFIAGNKRERGICSSRQFPPIVRIDTPTRAHLVLHWRTNHHDDIFAQACVQLIEEKRKEAITQRPVGRLANTSVPTQTL